jgi:pimeloyl-[acyl-carrier protein] methyl ester esterase
MKPRVLLLSGWAHGREALAPLAERLAAFCAPTVRSVHELARTADATDCTVAGPSIYARGLAALAAEEPGGWDVLAGWSMGAVVAIEAAAAATVRPGRLAVLAGTPCFCRAEGWTSGAAPQTVRAMRAALRTAPETVLRRFFADAAFPRVLTADAAQARAHTALAWGTEELSRGLDYLAATDLRGQLAGLTVPLLAVHGRQDRIVPWQAGEALAAGRGRLVLREEDGHDLAAGDPAALAAAIEHLLSEKR